MDDVHTSRTFVPACFTRWARTIGFDKFSGARFDGLPLSVKETSVVVHMLAEEPDYTVSARFRSESRRSTGLLRILLHYGMRSIEAWTSRGIGRRDLTNRLSHQTIW